MTFIQIVEEARQAMLKNIDFIILCEEEFQQTLDCILSSVVLFKTQGAKMPEDYFILHGVTYLKAETIEPKPEPIRRSPHNKEGEYYAGGIFNFINWDVV